MVETLVRQLFLFLALATACGATAEESDPSPFFEERSGDLVDWRPWSATTRQQLAEGDRPGLLLISHELNELSSAMERESFRNEEIAKRINEDFFPIALDKNQYPQIADFYAAYVWWAKQLRGWPLTIVVTPGLAPIEGGGYFPPNDGWGNQGLSSLTAAVAEHWHESRDRVKMKAVEELEELEAAWGVTSSSSYSYKEGLMTVFVENLSIHYDPENGGFGLPPKSVSFKRLGLLDIVAGRSAAGSLQIGKMRDKTLLALTCGSVRDFVGGGFFSAVTEETWTIPDFEKSAFAQIAAVNYLSGIPEYNALAVETAQALLNEFKNETGLYSENVAFVSSDSNNVSPHLWSYAELRSILSEEELEAFAARFGARPGGNVPKELDVAATYKGLNILKVRQPGKESELVKQARTRLREERMARIAIRRESVSSVDVNAAVASALCKLGGAFSEESRRLLDRLLSIYWDSTSRRLWASTNGGRPSRSLASSRGYALFVRALLDVGQSLDQPDYLLIAQNVQAAMERMFLSSEGIFLLEAEASPELPVRLAAFLESESGSANSIALENLERLSQLYPESRYEKKVTSILKRLPEEFSYAPEQYPDLLSAAARGR